MKITLEIPNGCKKVHFVLLLSDDETKTFGTTDGQFTPEDGGRYKIVIAEEGER